MNEEAAPPEAMEPETQYGNDNDDVSPVARPRILEVPLQSSEILEIVLDDLTEEPDQIRYMADMFALEKVPAETWIKTLDEFASRGSYDTANNLGEAGVAAFKRVGDLKSTVPLLCMMASYAIIQARSAPKQPLPRPRQYIVKDKPKAHYFARATQLVTQAEQIDSRNGFVLDTKANLFLLTSKYDEAGRIYDFIISQCPGHLFALMGKARIQYMRQQFRASLKLYQAVLSAAPGFLPDPRIGIGLCFWNLGEFAIARRAWERSRVVNPGKHSTGASLLLGLSYINEARQTTNRLSEDDRVEIYSTGINYVQDAWKHDKTCASTAAALSGYFLTASGKWDTVIKLAELAVQHGEAKAVISEGQLAIARALHAQAKYDDAARHYQQSLDMNKDQLVASMGLAQMSIIKKEYITAIGSFDQITRSHPKCLEALAVMAAIHSRQALTAPIATGTTSASEIAQARHAAKETYDIVVRLFQGSPDGDREPGYLDPVGPRVQQIARDPDLYVEIGRLWTGEDINKSLNAYRQALQIRQELEEEEVAQHSELTNGHLAQATTSLNATSRRSQLLSNIGALEFARGDYQSAQERFEQAVTLEAEKQQSLSESGASVSVAASTEADAVMMTLMYNLGIVMEARGQRDEAANLYEHRLLARHPEFLEAKARLAAIALQAKQYDRCQEFLKSALIAQPGHLDIRALYTYFNIEVNNFSAAKEFAVLTLKDQNRSDTYAMCAMAYLLYQQAREMRGTRSEEIKDRLSRFYRANEAFDKVLQHDPNCAYAAQGIAIALAESNLGARPTGGTATLASSEAAQRQKNLRDALTILAKVREVTNDGNVYVNIALCHFQREEFERAIENLETANNRFYRNKHLPTLLYLARARFHKAARDQSFSVLQDALASAEAALLLAPRDDSIRFNIALIQQRGLETLQELQPANRRLAEIQAAIKNAEIAQKSFRDLAENKTSSVSYSIDMADQRSRFIETMLRRAPATLREQEEWEQSEANKVEIARRDRDAERAKQAEVERVKREETRRQADELAAARRQMVEDARTWYVKPVAFSEDEDDKPKRGKGRKKKEFDGIVPDGEGEDVVKQPKKRKKADGAATGGKRKKKVKGESGQATAGGDGNTPPLSAEGSGAERDEEDEGPKRAGGRLKKAFRTKELISDSEDSD